MPNASGFVDNTSTTAHYAMLAAIKTFVEANGWTTQRYDTSTANHELILLAPGISGTEQIYVGIRTYQDVANDYYNFYVSAFTGYVSGNSFDTQPGSSFKGVCAHNNRIDYWMSMNGQRLAVAMKVGTPVYESFYIGKFLPYGTPAQFPYPVVASGTLNGAAATRFSDTTHSIGYKGNTAAMSMRFVDGLYKNPFAWPWGVVDLSSAPGVNYHRRPAVATYDLLPVVLHDNVTNVYGELDGIYSITGFNNAVENTITIGGVTYVVIQDVGRNSFIDYYALRMDA